MRSLLQLPKLASRFSGAAKLKGIEASQASGRGGGGGGAAIRISRLSLGSVGLRGARAAMADGQQGGRSGLQPPGGSGSGGGSGAGKKRSLGGGGSGGAGKRGGAAGSGAGVVHEQGSCRFTLDLGNKQVARIDYRLVEGQSTRSAGANSNNNNKRKVIEMYHTEVPRELRGRGIGKALASGAFEHVANDNMKVKLTCSYLIDYMSKFADPKYRKLVSK